MPEAARGDGTETVDTVHDAVGFVAIGCDAAPGVTATDACSGDVFINGIGAVRQGDAVQSHPFPSCAVHAPGLVTFSGTVRINGVGAGRKGDTYGCGALILTGSSTVNIGD